MPSVLANRCFVNRKSESTVKQHRGVRERANVCTRVISFHARRGAAAALNSFKEPSRISGPATTTASLSYRENAVSRLPLHLVFPEIASSTRPLVNNSRTKRGRRERERERWGRERETWWRALGWSRALISPRLYRMSLERRGQFIRWLSAERHPCASWSIVFKYVKYRASAPSMRRYFRKWLVEENGTEL